MVAIFWKSYLGIITKYHRSIVRSTKRKCFSQAEKPYFVTTPIFYVNSDPHIGHLYTAVVADAAQRFQRLLDPSSSCILSTGTDEHGLKIQQAAAAVGKSPLEFCTDISSSFKTLFNKTFIQYSDFIRTTEDRHRRTVEVFFNVLNSKGLICKQKHEGWYCVSDETFITEKCIKKELLPDGTITHKNIENDHVVEWCSEENYIFKLSQFQDDLLYWLKEDGRVVPSRFQEELKLWILKGLTDFSISRPHNRVSWGIPLPCDPSHTIYVWLDALVNYLTVVGYPNCIKWPPDLQVIGKDILRFHGIYWPAFLMASGLEPPRKLLVHSHWMVDNIKMSKSKGNVISPYSLIDRFSADGVRYLLLRKGVPHSDGSWNNVKAVEYVNAELANTLGNLINRCTPTSLNPDQLFPSISEEFLSSKSRTCSSLFKQIENLSDVVKHHYLNYNYYLGIEAVMSMLHTANLFLEEEKPWQRKSETHRKDLDSILGIGLTAARVAGIALQPIIPSISDNILNCLGVPKHERHWSYLNSLLSSSSSVQKLGPKTIIFKRITG